MLAGAVAEGMKLRLLHARREDLLRTARETASSALTGSGGPSAGALVLACSQRLYALDEGYPEELTQIREALGAPIAGTAVLGEIARHQRDVDAFFNLTATVVSFPV
jgi:hypothetical protein